MQKHHIDVAAGIEFAPTVPTEREECQRGRVHARFEAGKSVGGGEDVAEQYIHDLGAARTNFAAAAVRLMSEAESMFLDAEKFLVEGKDLSRSRSPSRSELALRMRENLVEVPGHCVEDVKIDQKVTS
jgi:hypothetical protein